VVPYADRDNPYRIPLALYEVAESSIPDTLEVVLHYLDGLPPELKNVYDEHIEIIHLDTLRRIWSGLLKLRENILPTEDELDAIVHAGEVFTELGRGLRSAAEFSAIPAELVAFIDSDIAAQLEDVSLHFLPTPTDAIAQHWFRGLRREGPFAGIRQPEP
jgi:hypothetical protein